MTNSMHMLDCLHEVGQITGIPANQIVFLERQAVLLSSLLLQGSKWPSV